MDDAEKLIWHPQVPLKVSIFAWRLLRDRLPTKANVVTRGILSTAAHQCVSGCGETEYAHHLFYLMWYFWFSLGISAFVDWHPGGGLYLFTRSLCPVYILSRWFSGTSIFPATHLACLRLGCVDGEKSQVVPSFSTHYSSVVGQDQTLFFRWLKATSATLTSNCHSWWYSHLF
ncbi:hypothetical protein QL285_093579 [Trifolium repens]|nr:hypothetical protein QL285_093579 [Trifolium repens]